MVTGIRHTGGLSAECHGEALAEAGEGGSPGADGIGKIKGSSPALGELPFQSFSGSLSSFQLHPQTLDTLMSRTNLHWVNMES